MNALSKAVQASFSPTNPYPSSLRPRQLLHPGRRKPALCFSGSEPDSSSSSSDSSSPSEGDKRKQDLLARIAMLQAQKVRLTDFLDERSAYLTQFAEDATAQFDQIGDDALKDLDQATSRIMENLENRMQAFEETAEANRQEIEKKEQLVEELEEKMERDRNEGLFFKNLTEKKPPPRGARAAEAGMEAKKLSELAREKAGSGARKNVYLALMALLGAAIANAVLASAEVEWRKVAALGFLLLALLAQYVYELQLSSQGDDEEDTTKNNK